MTGTITVSRAGDRLIAVKRAEGSRVHHLSHEAEMLRRLAHPGVIQLIDLVPSDAGAELHTVFVGPQTWASERPTTSTDLAAGAASLLAAVADLHETGITHNAIIADHVVVAPDNRPVLCSFGAAQAEPHSVVGTPASTGDLEQLGALLDSLATNDRDPVALGLGLIADDLRAGTLDARGASRRCDRLARDEEPDQPLTGVPRAALWSAAAAIAIVICGLVVSGLGDGSAKEDLAEASTKATSSTRVPAPTTTPPPVTTGPPPPSTTPTSAPATMPKATPTTLAANESADHDGLTIDHAGRRYAIGAQGDIAQLGDWDCDGVKTPAVLRPSTGEVIVFASWPDPGQSITATASWSIVGATDIRVDAQDGCDQLRVVTPEGSQLINPGEQA